LVWPLSGKITRSRLGNGHASSSGTRWFLGTTSSLSCRAQPDEAAVADIAVAGELGEGDLRHQLRLEPSDPAGSRRGPTSAARLALDPSNFRASSRSVSGG
jgi:hypothetical protein